MRCRNGSVRAVVSGTRIEIEVNATGDGPMNISFGNRPGAENEPRIEGQSMMEPQNNDLSGVSEASVGLMNSDEGRDALRRKPVGLTITVEKIDRILAEVQSQIDMLRRERTDLGLVRGQLANMESKGRGE